jgi:alanine racemase
MAEKPTKVATIPIGADGISRGWGNGAGFVIKKIKKAKILECLYGYVDG